MNVGAKSKNVVSPAHLTARVRILVGAPGLAARPAEVPRLALALGYWAFDAFCLILMFDALRVVADPFVLLVAYGVATTIAAIPLTPGA